MEVNVRWLSSLQSLVPPGLNSDVWLIIMSVIGLCWLLAFVGVAYDICATRRWLWLWWLLPTLLFGPIGATAFVWRWERTRRYKRRKVAPIVSIDDKQPTQFANEESIGLQTIPAGTGLFLLVRQGAMQDAYHSHEVPLRQPLVVRRAVSAEDRATPCELVLHDRAVSRKQHCRISRTVDGVLIEDTSTNGTLVDDRHILHSSVTLAIGSTIQIGTTELQLCDDRQVFPTAPNR